MLDIRMVEGQPGLCDRDLDDGDDVGANDYVIDEVAFICTPWWPHLKGGRNE